jgi:hypothetical protein
VDKAKADPVLGNIIEANEAILEENSDFSDAIILCIFLLYEW